MNTQKCSGDESFIRLRQVVDENKESLKRKEILTLFVAAFAKFPNGASGLMMRVIERLLKQKLSPIEEIRSLFTSLTSCENIESLMDVLITELPAKHAKLQYFLRLYTLRTMMSDKDLAMSTDTLYAIAGDKDIGRMSVIDFILTRRQPRPELARLISVLISELEDRERFANDPKRMNAVAKLTAKFSENNEPFSLNAITSHKQILANWNKIVLCSPSEIREWLVTLRKHNETMTCTDSLRKALSSSLINIGTSFKDDPVIVDMWNVAIELENMSSKPSSHILHKVWRLCIAVKLHPKADIRGVVVGLKLGFKFLGVPETAETLTNEQLKSFAGISSAISQFRTWNNLIEFLVSDSEEEYKTLIYWLLITIASTTKTTIPACEIERLMSITASCSLETKLELEQSFCSISGSCFNESLLLSVLKSEENSKYRIGAILALAKSYDFNGDTVSAYRICQKLKLSDASVPAIKDLLYELGFADIALQLGISLDFVKDVRFHELNRQIIAAKEKSDNVHLVDLLVTSWFSLCNRGCYHDASRYISTALEASEKLLGPHSVRHLSIMRLNKEFNEKFLHSSSMSKEDNPSITGIHPALETTVGQVSRIWSCSYPEVLLKFNQEYENLEGLLRRDALWSIFPDAALASPSLIVSNGVGFDHKTRALVEKLLQMGAELKNISWMERLQIANRLRWLYLIGSNMGMSLEKFDSLISSFLISDMYWESIESSRAFYSGNSKMPLHDDIPANVVCICLNFDDKDELYLTRLEHGSAPISFRLPADRISDLNAINPITEQKTIMGYSSAISQIEKIIEDSINTSHSSAKEFWDSQSILDSRLKNLVGEIQRSWFGGFLGLISTPVGQLKCDSSIVTKLESIFSVTLDKRSRKSTTVRWHLNPVFVPLLQYLIDRDYKEEVEDLVTAVLDTMKFHGLSVSHDEINMWKLVKEIKAVLLLHNTKARPEQLAQSRQMRALLVCDRRASQIPWELFPVFKEFRSITRALSLQQAREWAALRPPKPKEVSYIVNPSQDLPPTHKLFIQNFEYRGWTGLAGIKPTEEEFASHVRKSRCFVYVGHGSGKKYIRGSSLRKLFATHSDVYLLGCESVRIKHLLMDDDPLTEYSVMGSRLIMGTLWAVKDRDFNRFTHEFLSRIFDENESVGEALQEARSACILPYLTGGAPVVYGLP